MSYLKESEKPWLCMKNAGSKNTWVIFRSIPGKGYQEFEDLADGLTERAAKQIAAALNACNAIVKTIEDQSTRPTYASDRRKWEAKRLEAIRLAAVTGADEQ